MRHLAGSFVLKAEVKEMPVKVLIAKLGLDSHWRGAMMVARFLRDRGMEVVYVGNQTPAAIVESAIQEDVDVIGLSTLSGNHPVYVPMVFECLKARSVNDVPVVLGGTIPQEDYEAMQAAGVRAVFGPGRPLHDIAQCIGELAAERSRA
ncbi:MAG: methylmalonyl-CoA mutase [Peptococcaceae bacterium]|jgi:methylmalonyl-CoA mutase C-terminal domain/subunit|nr:MAG: methylmalonyl-CoA mutase [Peptococcaceae bacterium]